MRLLSLLLVFPCFLFSQAQTTVDLWPQKRLLRMGLQFSSDFQPAVPYTFKNSKIVGIPQRKSMIDLTADAMIWPRRPSLRAQAQLGYYQPRFEDGVESSQILSNWHEAEVNEKIDYHHLQLAVGLHFDLLPKATFSPYFQGHFLLGIPTKISYELFTNNGGVSLPSYRLVEGGGRLSPGWKMTTGLRVLLCPRLAVNLGVYYVEQDMRIRWPNFTERDFYNTLLHLQNTGLSVGAQFGW